MLKRLAAFSSLLFLPITALALIGGRPVDPGEFASQLSLQLPVHGSPGEFIHHCSASRISPSWILTAAHCLEGSLAVGTSFRILSGADLTAPAHSSASRVLERRLAPDASGGSEYDLGLVRVSASSLGRVPIALISDDPLREKDIVHVTGYGCESSDASGPSTELKAGRTRVNQVHHSEITVPADPFGGFFPTLCLGDSGGALFKAGPDGRSFALVGVNSGLGLADPSTGNSRIVRIDRESAFDALRWIRSALQSSGEAPHAP